MIEEERVRELAAHSEKETVMVRNLEKEQDKNVELLVP